MQVCFLVELSGIVKMHLLIEKKFIKNLKKLQIEVNGKFNVNYSDEIPNVAIS